MGFNSKTEIFLRGLRKNIQSCPHNRTHVRRSLTARALFFRCEATENLVQPDYYGRERVLVRREEFVAPRVSEQATELVNVDIDNFAGAAMASSAWT